MASINLQQYAARLPNDPEEYLLYNPRFWELFCRILGRPELRYTDANRILYHPLHQMPGHEIYVAHNNHDDYSPLILAHHDVVSNGLVPAGWQAFTSALLDSRYAEEVRASLQGTNAPIMTDSLTLRHAAVGVHPSMVSDSTRYTWSWSPVARCTGSYESYLASLASRRRRKVRQAVAAWGNLRLDTEGVLTSAELQWALTNLNRRRQYENWAHALRQLIAGIAAAAAGVGVLHRFYTSENKLCAISYHVRAGRTMVYQGMVKDETQPTDGLGVYALNAAIEQFCTDPTVDYLDPTCVTIPFEPPHKVDVYKRGVVNQTDYRASFMAGFGEQDLRDATPPYYDFETAAYTATDLVTWTQYREEDL